MTLIFAVFDFLGDLDFALAAEQRHRAHLAQIHAHRIAGLADHVAVDVAVDLFLFFFFFGKLVAGTAERDPLVGVDDFDVHFAEDRHDIVDLVRRDHLGWQHIVDVVVGQIALLLAQVDELLDLLQILLLHRLRRRSRRRLFALAIGWLVSTRAFGVLAGVLF